MVSKAAVEKYGDGTEGMVIGTGAYKLKDWTLGQGVTLTTNEYYWGEKPYFEEINFKVITDTTTALAAPGKRRTGFHTDHQWHGRGVLWQQRPL